MPRRSALAGFADRWRWWMVAPILATVLAIAAVVRVPADVVWPEEVVDVAQLVDVTMRDAGAADDLAGTFLTARRRGRPTVLGWLGAIAPGGGTAGSPAPAEVDHFDPLESALLLGAGVSPGRGHVEQLGLSAAMRDERTPTSVPAIVLYVADAVSSQDLAAGRRILALGVLGSGLTLRCPEDGLATYRAASPPPDLVVIAERCPDAPALRGAGASLLEATSVYDAVQGLIRGRAAGSTGRAE